MFLKQSHYICGLFLIDWYMRILQETKKPAINNIAGFFVKISDANDYLT